MFAARRALLCALLVAAMVGNSIAEDDDDGASAQCKCKSGAFSHPATHRLGGTVKGLANGQVLVLSSASPDVLGEHESERVAREASRP